MYPDNTSRVDIMCLVMWLSRIANITSRQNFILKLRQNAKFYSPQNFHLDNTFRIFWLENRAKTYKLTPETHAYIYWPGSFTNALIYQKHLFSSRCWQMTGEMFPKQKRTKTNPKYYHQKAFCLSLNFDSFFSKYIYLSTVSMFGTVNYFQANYHCFQTVKIIN